MTQPQFAYYEIRPAPHWGFNDPDPTLVCLTCAAKADTTDFAVSYRDGEGHDNLRCEICGVLISAPTSGKGG